LENAIQRCVVLNSSASLKAVDLEWLLGPEAINGIQEDLADIAGIPAQPEQLPIAEPAPPPLDFSHDPDGIAETYEHTSYSSEPAFAAPFTHQVTDLSKALTGVALGAPVTLSLGLPLPDLERFWLLSTLAAVDGNRTRCAQQLNIALRTVRNKINEYKKEGYAIPGGRQGRED
jgi:DNA-binding NtrC family response regulator